MQGGVVGGGSVTCGVWGERRVVECEECCGVWGVLWRESITTSSAVRASALRLPCSVIGAST